MDTIIQQASVVSNRNQWKLLEFCFYTFASPTPTSGHNQSAATTVETRSLAQAQTFTTVNPAASGVRITTFWENVGAILRSYKIYFQFICL